MKTYSDEMRQEIVDRYCQGEGTIRQLAQRFGVSRIFVRRLLKRERQMGRVIPRLHRTGPKPLLQDAHYQILQQLVAADNDATLQQLVTRFEEQTQMKVSTTTVSRALKKLGMAQINRRKRCSNPK